MILKLGFTGDQREGKKIASSGEEELTRLAPTVAL